MDLSITPTIKNTASNQRHSLFISDYGRLYHMIDYKSFIQENFKIVNKDGKLVEFLFNPVQDKYYTQDMTENDDVLKARQQGFSSLFTGFCTADFLLWGHSHSTIVADIEENAQILLDKTKLFIRSFEEKNDRKITLKYDTRNELYNSFMDSKIKIGTAKNVDFGRSRTMTRLILTEAARYPDLPGMIASAGQAVVPSGYKTVETTANGFNDYKRFRTENNGFSHLFYPASKFYSKQFLADKQRELGQLFPQEYPDTEIESFLTSGSCFFNTDSLRWYLDRYTKQPIQAGNYA